MAQTTRFTRRHLPHWEVETGRYFVTVRCADSLPKEAALRLNELARSLLQIAPRSAQFAALQRETFRTVEKYLDRGHGLSPFRDAGAADIVRDELFSLADWQVKAPHFTIMPNH